MKNRLPELDALRGVAALSVVIYHYVVGKVSPDLQWLNIGCMGVDMFFIISGLVIFMSVSKLATWQSFLKSRLIRLFPAYWVCVTFSTFLILLAIQSFTYAKDDYELTNNMLVKYAANMTMLNYYFRISYVEAVYWTLTVEIGFYVVIAVIIRFGILHLMEKLGSFALLVSAAYSLNAVATNTLFHKLLVLVPLIAYWPLFFAGILLYKMKFEQITAARIILIIATYIIQCTMFKNAYTNIVFLTLFQYISVLAVIYGIFALLLFDKLNFIVNPVTSWLGKISYPLYLIHSYLGFHLIIPYLKQHNWAHFPAMVVAIIVALGLAELVNKFVEIPAASYFKSRLVAKPNLIKS